MSENDKKLGRSAIIVSAVFLIGGLYMFFSNAEYIEDGHNRLMLIYSGLCLVFFWLFKKWKLVPLVLCVFVMVTIMVFVMQKFEWRKNYVEASSPFFLEEYITDYPTLEDYLIASYRGGENWIAFSKNCAEPAMLGKRAPSDCSSLQSVKDNYGIDLKKAAFSQFKKMQSTAKRIETGKFKTSTQYKNCVETKSCAEIPMLPNGVDAQKIAKQENAYVEIRRAYWALIDERKITAPVCEFMKLCRIMIKLDIVDPNNIKL